MAVILRRREAEKDRPLGLYLHVPFCQKKCLYCDFYSLPCGEVPESLRKRYLEAQLALLEAYASRSRDYLVDTVYLGGGTPSLLTKEEITALFRAIRKLYRLTPDCEITAELNPASGARDTLKALRKAGVNRLSIGLQSVHEKELKALGRLHSFDDFAQTLVDAKAAGFDNIGADLMYGIPEQTMDSFKQSLAKVTALPLTHVSVYGLTIEERTPFARMEEALVLPDEETERAMYFTAIRELARFGFKQDEISNFSRPGYESRHNTKYWNCDEYLGFGPAAASYFGGQRFTYVRDLAAFCGGVLDGAEGLVEEMEDCPAEAAFGEYVMLRLRLTEGIDKNVFFRKFHRDFDELFKEKTAKYLQSGHMGEEGGRIFLTPEGFYLSNHILADLLENAE